MTFRRSFVAFACLIGVLAFAPNAAQAAPRVLYVTLPGPLEACSILSPNASESSVAIADLLYPSAFLNGSHDQQQGTGAGIVSAELNSVAPETVNYTVGPNLKWSNGQPFTAASLVTWWQRAKTQPSVMSDGYRKIKSMTLSADHLSVLVTFSTTFANWPQLFRDVLASTSPLDCRLHNLVDRPTLGYYRVESVSRHTIVLTKSSLLHRNQVRYSKLIISDALPTTKGWAHNFVGVIPSLTPQSISLFTGISSLATQVTPSTSITEMAFAPSRPQVSSAAVREALAVSVNRQIMVNGLYGAATLSVKPAQSSLFSQGQYLASSSNSSAPTDCLTCAVEALRGAGYSQIGSGWKSPGGTPVSLRLVVGPSDADKNAASFIVNTWRVIGIPAFQVPVSTEQKAAQALAYNTADVAIFTRSTAFGPAVCARSLFGARFSDAFSFGITSPVMASLGEAIVSNLNAAQALTQWQNYDASATHAYLVRPLFSAPVIETWSQRFNSLAGGGSIMALLDQLPTLHP